MLSHAEILLVHTEILLSHAELCWDTADPCCDSAEQSWNSERPEAELCWVMLSHAEPSWDTANPCWDGGRLSWVMLSHAKPVLMLIYAEILLSHSEIVSELYWVMLSHAEILLIFELNFIREYVSVHCSMFMLVSDRPFPLQYSAESSTLRKSSVGLVLKWGITNHSQVLSIHHEQ